MKIRIQRKLKARGIKLDLGTITNAGNKKSDPRIPHVIMQRCHHSSSKHIIKQARHPAKMLSYYLTSVLDYCKFLIMQVPHYASSSLCNDVGKN